MAVRRATLPVTLFMQAAATAAVLAPTVAAPMLLERLQLPPVAVGLFVALVYLAATFSSPIGAQCVRRFGPIRSSQFGLLCSAVGLACVVAPWAWIAMIGALLVGTGYGPITPASSQMLSRTTPVERYALVFSVKQTGVPLGGVIVGFMVPPLLVWSGPAAALGGVAALCLLGAASAVPLRLPFDTGRDTCARWLRLSSVSDPLLFVARHAVLRRVAASSFVLSMVQVCFSAYLVTFLTSDWRWTLVAAGAALAAAQSAGVVGRILWGIVSDRGLGARATLFMLSAGMMLCTVGLPFARDWPLPASIALICLYGATAVGWNGVYLATVARVVPREQAAVATAGTLSCTFLGVVVGPPVFGIVSQAFGAIGPAFALLAAPLLLPLWLMRKGEWS